MIEIKDRLESLQFIRFVRNICKESNISYETYRSNKEFIL